jgi:hypothetical protein
MIRRHAVETVPPGKAPNGESFDSKDSLSQTKRFVGASRRSAATAKYFVIAMKGGPDSRESGPTDFAYQIFTRSLGER